MTAVEWLGNKIDNELQRIAAEQYYNETFKKTEQ